MRMAILAGLVSLLLCGHVLADSIINYTVELAPFGPTHAAYVAGWKTGTNRILFPAGNSADSQQFTIGDVITWDVVAALDPNETHTQPNHPSNGFKPYGIANIVFNLELTDANDGPVNTGVFFSAINDGTGMDPIAAAAFAASYNFLNKGPGRLIDQVSGTTQGAGGPNMALFTYPTAMPDKMVLLGHGAGYVQWKRTSATNATITIPGVGLAKLPNGANGMGVVPLFEGQIDTSNMAPGTYKLKVIPGAGVNVLRGDYTPPNDLLAGDKDAFAVAVNRQNGHTLTFTLVAAPVGCEVAPVVASATSIRTHGAAGLLGIPLNLTGTVSVEPRDGGPQQIVIAYDKAIKAADGTLDTEVALAGGELNGAPTIEGSTLVINVMNVANASCLAITINGITCAEGGVVAPETVLKVIAQKGDVNGNGVVNAADIGVVKSLSLQPLTASNARSDVNVSGGINAADIGIVKSLSLVNPAPTCP